MVKKCIAYTFLIIFSLQILPIKEIGKILYKGLLTEERSETDICEDEIPSPGIKKDTDPYHSESNNIALVKISASKIQTAIHISDNIPIQHVPDIVTPPPDFLHI